jgi:outer membrane protein TolC
LLRAQTFRERETFGGLSSPRAISDTLPASKYLQEHVVDGKVRLSLHDAIVAMLMNNTDVQIQELSIENSKYNLLRAHAPFDPTALAGFSALRSFSQTFSQLAGAPTLTTLSQVSQLAYTQAFETGTNVQVGFNATRLTSNSDFNFFNPSIDSNFTLQITQPLLRNRWLFANRAPLVIARRNLRATRATFEAQVNNAILGLVSQYWSVVQARGNFEVARKSQDAADASYKRDKRALELGALPPLDIYRSESQVATRRVLTIQSEYQLKQAEDALRFTLGAETDPVLRALDLELTETPARDALLNVDSATALQQALEGRPELEAMRQALANDDTSIRLAHNNLLPDLKLSGTYSSNGLGGNQFDANNQLISRGGLGDSLSQLFGFGFPSYGFSLTLNLPIKNRGAQADLGDFLVSRRHDLFAERRLREQIVLEVTNAIHQLEQAKLSVAASQVALELSKKNLAAEQRKIELGEKTSFFVLDAQTQVAQEESNLLQAETNYEIAVAAVQHATGKLLEPYQIQIKELTR